MNINNISSQLNQENLIAGKVQLPNAVPQNLENNAEAAQAVQVQFNDAVKAALLEMTKNIGQRTMLLASLPSEIKEMVSTILKENTAGTKEVTKGFTAILQTQRQAVDKLIDLSEVLDSAILYRQKENLSPALTKAILLFGTIQKEDLQQSKDLVLAENAQFDTTEQLSGKGFKDEKQIPALVRQLFSRLSPEEKTNFQENLKTMIASTENNLLDTADITDDITDQLSGKGSKDEKQIPVSARKLFSQLFSEEEMRNLTNHQEPENIIVSGKSFEAEKQGSVLLKQLLTQFFPKKDIQFLKELPNFRELFSAFEQQIPEDIQQAAIKFNLPELTDAYILLKMRSVFSQKELPASKLAEMLNASVGDQENVTTDSFLTSLKILEKVAPENQYRTDDILLLVSKLADDIQFEGKEQLFAQTKQLLQQLFLGDNAQMLSKDMDGIRNLFSRLGQHVPQNLLQFAEENHLPNLTDAYILLKLQDVLQWKDMHINVLRECAAKLRDLTASLQNNITENGGEKNLQQTIATFSVPIYFAGNSQPFPLYIHIYSDGKPKSKKTVNKDYDVWMRMSLQTENIGVVDILLHWFGERQLSLKVDFSHDDYADSFLDFVPRIRTHIDELAIRLTDIHIRANQQNDGWRKYGR